MLGQLYCPWYRLWTMPSTASTSYQEPGYANSLKIVAQDYVQRSSFCYCKYKFLKEHCKYSKLKLSILCALGRWGHISQDPTGRKSSPGLPPSIRIQQLVTICSTNSKMSPQNPQECFWCRIMCLQVCSTAAHRRLPKSSRLCRTRWTTRRALASISTRSTFEFGTQRMGTRCSFSCGLIWSL